MFVSKSDVWVASDSSKAEEMELALSELPSRFPLSESYHRYEGAGSWQDNLSRLSLSDSHSHVVSQKFQQLNATTTFR